jgi:hypothetical protein
MTDLFKPGMCVGSGFCCKKAPCPFGEWSNEKQQCEFLELEVTHDAVEIYRCGKAEEIKKHPDAWFSPAFGAGCCSPLGNRARNRTIQHLKGGDDKSPVYRALIGRTTSPIPGPMETSSRGSRTKRPEIGAPEEGDQVRHGLRPQGNKPRR